MSVVVSYKKQFLVGVLFFIVIIAAIEGIARTYEFAVADCKFLHMDAFKGMDYFQLRQMCQDSKSLIISTDDSSSRFFLPNQHYETININAHGLRGEEISKEKPENTYRIIMVGGSTTFGSGSTSDKTTIPGFLQKIFDETELKQKVEVINAGLPGATSKEESKYITNYLLEFEPDFLIIYDGWNDARYVSKALLDKDQVEEEEPLLFKLQYIPEYRTPFVIYRVFIAPIQGLEAEPIGEEFDPKVVKVWKERWENICKISKEKNISTMIVVQPIVGTGNKELSTDESKYAPHSGWIKYRTTVKILNSMGNSISELEPICDKTSDLRNVFDEIKEPVFYDHGHVNDLGNEIVAKKIYEISIPLINKKTND
jgi:hypothetical protein